MGASTVLADSYHQLDLDVDADFYYEQTLQIGKQLGLLSAFAIDF